MHANVSRPIEMLPPPARPVHNSGNWQKVEDNLGTVLPDDFKDFVHVYGSVEICDWLWLHTPFALTEDLRSLVDKRLKEFDMVPEIRAEIPFPDYPSPGGVLPIGTTEDADMIAWITEGPPNSWCVVFLLSGNSQIHIP